MGHPVWEKELECTWEKELLNPSLAVLEEVGPEREVIVLPVLLPIHLVQAEVEAPRVSSIQPLAEGHHILVGPGPLPVCCEVLFLYSNVPSYRYVR